MDPAILSTKVGVLDKAMAILRTFPHGDVALFPLEIAARTDLPLSTVYRLTQALAEHGMLEKDGQRFRLGIALLHLGMLVAEGIDLRRTVMPHLRWLCEQTGENAELHIRHNDARIAVEAARSSQNLRPIVDIGAPLPLHAGAAGKVLLAWLPPAEQDALAAASARRHASLEPYDQQQLREHLRQVRREGWAASDSERAPGVAAIAAPIFDVTGSVAGAITLTAPSIRLTAKHRQIYIPLIIEAAARASADLGYVRHPGVRPGEGSA